MGYDHLRFDEMVRELRENKMGHAELRFDEMVRGLRESKMGYAELRFDEMVRELRESNRLLAKLVKSTESIDKNLRYDSGEQQVKEKKCSTRV